MVGFSSIAQAQLLDGLRAYVKGEYDIAFRELKPFAAKGQGIAQYALGAMYENGRGVRQDDKKAVKWYRQAADQGVAKAQFNLGGMYGIGWGVPENHVQAYKWLELAAAGGLKEAMEARMQLAKLMTADQITIAQSLANKWRPKPTSLTNANPASASMQVTDRAFPLAQSP